MKISVPATSANLGAGFDSIGIAVNLYLEIEILEVCEEWLVIHELGDDVPSDVHNLLIETALDVAQRFSKKLVAHKIKMVSEVPLARGLGSSSSVIVAGIELANQLAELHLTNDEKLQLATEIEGHPDNVAPAIFGNLVIASTVEGKTTAVQAAFPECALLAFVPNYELKTSDSRRVLPENLTYKEAVAASSIANVLTASLLTANLEKAGEMIEADRFHEKYRKNLVKELSILREIAHENGAYATYLSGAGPTIMIITNKKFLTELSKKIAAENFDGKLLQLKIDTAGVQVRE
ncbi:homoserine kinase [Lactococcus nasutitermitis]|uniref:Homoserine kinase n=1 Tax=Lactococcus nasutitermitis TaxID=1652957 RepID=A0ABV9JHI4_9LACT|nr:homoserine kinase [Lactococcus nasutitermitis]